ncbi:GNAT family N-acetyltransferase [Pontibacter sp. BAB1700]|uniref:GNAT family N-acetyltransferase n=1 Tax=Pontibacter sp. BAB1700 TaxID=1144253 RepID=UPI00026BC9BF|nr:GNAT family protein [Pontibacter sp. BAB1700]EJF09714.1 pseudaminic acid biosynthesis N-acetyl transferase [Pontibacter sp. BAB1700]
MSKIKQICIDKLSRLAPVEGNRWELISHAHTSSIVKWRNDPENLIFFEQQNRLQKKEQTKFINNYNAMDRIDLVLIDQNPIGVFSIKNLSTMPEYGALIGDKQYRGKGIGSKAKYTLFDFWFNEVKQEVIYTKNKSNNTQVLESNLALGFEVISNSKSSDDFTVMKLQKATYLRILK